MRNMNSEKVKTSDTVSPTAMMMPKIEDIFSSTEISFDNLEKVFQDRFCHYAFNSFSPPDQDVK